MLGGSLALALLAPVAGADAKGFSVLYSFAGYPNDGGCPAAGLLADEKGDLYGTTLLGGPNDDGVVFKLARDGIEKVMHSFAGGSDGLDPFAGLIADQNGNLYGTTELGGAGCSQNGCGTIYKVAPDGSETVLYAFTAKSDGANPVDSLLADSAGNLDGTALQGGLGYGTVFQLAPNGTLTTLYTFSESDGATPLAALVADAQGNFYSTTHGGGAGYGTVFRLAPNGTETVLWDFNISNEFGTAPLSGTIMDGKGDVYGTTAAGDLQNGCGGGGCGVVYEITAKGEFKVLYTFQGGSDGYLPAARLIADSKGNLYGTTEYGGAGDMDTVFKLSPHGKKTVLHAFTGESDGGNPEASLIADKKGNLYRTASTGGSSCDCGVVFKISE
jgi:uncharacterized repeat protein (TIGR03803 family)